MIMAEKSIVKTAMGIGKKLNMTKMGIKSIMKTAMDVSWTTAPSRNLNLCRPRWGG